jgi:hypothetical protein
MSDPQKKPGTGFRATVVVLVVLVAYPLSFGPALWYSVRYAPANVQILAAYRPLAWILQESPVPVRRFIAQHFISPTLRESGRNLVISGTSGIYFAE